jgi:hypothetical protein
VLEDVGAPNVLDGGVRLSDAGVGDDDVEVGDAMLFRELLDGVEGVLLDAGVILDYDQAAARALRQLGEREGRWVRWVAVRGDDGLLFSYHQFLHHSC